MDEHLRSPLERAIELIGLGKLAKHLALSGQAIRKWQAAGRLPRTEWTGETAYAEKIECLSDANVTKAELLAKWPSPTVPSAAIQLPQVDPAPIAPADRRGVAPCEQHRDLSPFGMGVDRREHGDAELAVEGAR